MVVAVGALLVGPFLAHVSTSLLGSRAMQEGMNKEYAGDAGVEFGIWKLVNDSTFRSQVDSTPGTPVPLGPITVNQFTTTISVTALSTGGWSTLADALANVGAGGALAYAGGDYIYALRGNNTDDFWRYSISGNSWASLANTPTNIQAGGALVYTGGDYIYAFQGNGSTAFWRYSISQDSWDDTLPPAPDTIGDGGALTYDGTYIYAFRGGNRDDFWRFSPGPSTYDITATADGVTISAQVVISGTDVTIQA